MLSLKQTALRFLTAALIAACGAVNAENPIVKLETNVGDVTVLLYADKAPKTVENFLVHVDEGFYKNTIFHRVIDNFMVQGGGFDVDLKERDSGRTVVNESKNRLHAFARFNFCAIRPQRNCIFFGRAEFSSFNSSPKTRKKLYVYEHPSMKHSKLQQYPHYYRFVW